MIEHVHTRIASSKPQAASTHRPPPQIPRKQHAEKKREGAALRDDDEDGRSETIRERQDRRQKKNKRGHAYKKSVTCQSEKKRESAVCNNKKRKPSRRHEPHDEVGLVALVSKKSTTTERQPGTKCTRTHTVHSRFRGNAFVCVTCCTLVRGGRLEPVGLLHLVLSLESLLFHHLLSSGAYSIVTPASFSSDFMIPSPATPSIAFAAACAAASAASASLRSLSSCSVGST